MSQPTHADIAARLRRWSEDILKADGIAPDGRPVGLSLIRALPFSLVIAAIEVEALDGSQNARTDQPKEAK